MNTKQKELRKLILDRMDWRSIRRVRAALRWPEMSVDELRQAGDEALEAVMLPQQSTTHSHSASVEQLKATWCKSGTIELEFVIDGASTMDLATARGMDHVQFMAGFK